MIDSFNAAVSGLIYVLRSQRNMRFHFLAAALILVVALLLPVDQTDILFLLSAVALVLLSEMINTSLELAMDVVQESYHPRVKVIKDVSAGAVFICALYAVAVGYLVFWKYLVFPLELGLQRLRHSTWHIAFTCLAVVAMVTVVIKIVFHRGTPMQGGMPSVHSAVSFAILTLIALLPGTPLVAVVLVFFLACLVAQSRIASRIHTFYEVISGAAWGSAITFFLFTLLYR